MSEVATKTRRAVKEKISEPERFKVILHNDDQTPYDFVVGLLIKIFRVSADAAVAITNEVHQKGKGVAGVYTFEIAEQRCSEGTTISRSNGFPLVLTIEPS